MLDRPDAIMIFAAGFGTRMMPLTKNQPKPMVKVGGRPMIDRARDIAREAGFTTVVSNTHYKAEVLEAHLRGTEVKVIREEPDILDTGGGLRNAFPQERKRTIATLNPDAIWHGPNPFDAALTYWQPDQMDALLVCVRPEKAHGTDSAGDFSLGADGRILRGAGVLYGGAQIIKTELLGNVLEDVFSLNIIWDQMIAKGTCFGTVYDGEWCDVGHPQGIALAEDMIGYFADE